MVRFLTLMSVAVLMSSAFGQTRDEQVRGDRKKVEAEGFWIYNDLDQAFAEADRSGKPILVVLRCIPCHECVKLDDELVDQDPVIRPLLEKFVCARQVSTNGLDLDTFQFDTDQSFAVFMLNADGTIYGRFGTRSHRTEWFGDVSLPGLAKALQGALDLHADYPGNKSSLAGKKGAPLEYASPELFPSLKDKFTDSLNYQGDVVKSCIHCHQIGDARREFYRNQGRPIPDRILYPYPHPKAVGLILDSEHMATVKDVAEGSAAAKSGFRPGDEIRTMNGQPLLSIADVQWILDHVDPDGGEVAATIKRGDQEIALNLVLAKDWRRKDDISWRVSSWGLRRMVTGGLVLETLPDEDRRRLNISGDSMALRVKGLGQYGAHATAKKAGFQKGDVIVSFDGRSDLMNDGELLAYGATNTKPGQKVEVRFLRDGRAETLRLPMQN